MYIVATGNTGTLAFMAGVADVDSIHVLSFILGCANDMLSV